MTKQRRSNSEKGQTLTPFLVLLACAALFVWLTSQTMPSIVASHFDATGQANGFMPREVYRVFMLAIVILVPLVLVTLPNQALQNPKAQINLPRREYWLAPERRHATIEYLSHHFVRFAYLLLAFLCYVHWLVVRANHEVPPHLSTAGLVSGLVVFLFANVAWVIQLLRRFRNTPL